MRRIRSHEEIEKSQKRMKYLVGGLLIFLMLFSTAGYAIFLGGGSSSGGEELTDELGNNNNNQIVVDGVVFNGQHWIYNTGGQQYLFTNHLNQVEEISVDISVSVSTYSGSPLFVASDSEEVEQEISRNLGRYASRVQRACYGECEEDLPEKDCTENIIIFRENDENKVYQEDKCIFIDGDLNAVDAFLYNLLGLN